MDIVLSLHIDWILDILHLNKLISICGQFIFYGFTYYQNVGKWITLGSKSDYIVVKLLRRKINVIDEQGDDR